MGFYWLGLFIYFWDRKRGLAWTFGALGLLHGSIMGFGRMAQGGHWFTDVVWAAGFVYLSGWMIHHFLISPEGLFRSGNRELKEAARSSPELGSAMVMRRAHGEDRSLEAR
jgi:membrane-associated PAP2 superfamily phosphatase